MASDYLLEIDGIKGESGDAKHKDQIEIESFSWGVTNPGSFAAGAGGGVAKASFHDLHFTTKVNKASPVLMLSCATGKHIPKAVLTVRKAGGKQEEYYKIKLADVMISSYQSGGSESSHAAPTDQFSLNFAKLEFEYKPQKADGSLDAAVNGGYDLKKSEKV